MCRPPGQYALPTFRRRHRWSIATAAAPLCAPISANDSPFGVLKLALTVIPHRISLPAARLYASSRLYINFFQPSFKLKSKTRDGARVHKVYLAPATPCDRLLAHDSVEPAIKEKLKAHHGQSICMHPDAPSQVALTQAEVELLDQVVKDTARTAHAPPLSRSLIKLAQLGGYLARASDPPPGNTVIWRGLRRLVDIQLGFELANCG
jgi:hypothetical protein